MTQKSKITKPRVTDLADALATVARADRRRAGGTGTDGSAGSTGRRRLTVGIGSRARRAGVSEPLTDIKGAEGVGCPSVGPRRPCLRQRWILDAPLASDQLYDRVSRLSRFKGVWRSRHIQSTHSPTWPGRAWSRQTGGRPIQVSGYSGG